MRGLPAPAVFPPGVQARRGRGRRLREVPRLHEAHVLAGRPHAVWALLLTRRHGNPATAVVDLQLHVTVSIHKHLDFVEVFGGRDVPRRGKPIIQERRLLRARAFALGSCLFGPLQPRSLLGKKKLRMTRAVRCYSNIHLTGQILARTAFVMPNTLSHLVSRNANLRVRGRYF